MGESQRRVAVVGDDDRSETLREAVRDAGARLVTVTDTTTDTDAMFTVGEDVTRHALRNPPAGAVIPVGTQRLGFGVEEATNRMHQLFEALDSSVEGISRITHPILTVDTGTPSVHRAAADVALITEKPARISEFSIRFTRRPTESFRADGVVVATPFGSSEYANAAGGPIVEPGGGLVVAPIAPFSTGIDAWVAAEHVTVSVERETEPVVLVIDGAIRDTVGPYQPIDIETTERVEALVPTATTEPRARRSETL